MEVGKRKRKAEDGRLERVEPAGVECGHCVVRDKRRHMLHCHKHEVLILTLQCGHGEFKVGCVTSCLPSGYRLPKYEHSHRDLVARGKIRGRDEIPKQLLLGTM